MVQRAFPGQAWAPPLATDWNDIGEATEIYLRHHRTRDTHQLKQWIIATEWMLCRNDSGGNRRAGEVLEAGDYLLTDIDPFSPWFVGQVPTAPVGNSTHGILRAAMKSGQTSLERVQVSGVVRAWVNVVNANHNFCNAVAGEHVLKSNGAGPHKIIYKPSGTGEKECFILLYAAEDSFLIAEAYISQNLCPNDPVGTGTGTGAADPAVSGIIDAKLMPSCTAFTPDRVVNPFNRAGPAYSKITMYRRFCDGVEEWVIFNIEHRKFCAVAGVESRASCLVGWGLGLWVEWCPTDEPTGVCVIEEYDDCGTSLPPCDTTLVWDPLYACCLDSIWGSGTGSGT